MNVMQSAGATSLDIPDIGQYWPGQGGIYAGVMPGDGEHAAEHLVFSTDEGVHLNWGAYTDDPVGALSDFDGAANTAILVAQPRDYPAAQWAHGYEKDGHHDFHLPSRREWQTAAATIPGAFSDNTWYWTSTEHSWNRAYGQNFAGVEEEHFHKGFWGNARAVRTMPALGPDTGALASAPRV